MGDEIRIKRDTEVFFSVFQDLVADNLTQARAELKNATDDQLREQMARIDAKVSALLALMVSHSRERMGLNRKIEILFQSVDSIAESFEESSQGLHALNEELMVLRSQDLDRDGR